MAGSDAPAAPITYPGLTVAWGLGRVVSDSYSSGMDPDDDVGHAISFLALRRGTPVRSSEGLEVGAVRRVQNNAREHIFDGIVIDTAEGPRFVDAPEVARIYERAVVLTIGAAEVAGLPEPGGRVSARLKNTTSARRAKRFSQRMRDRWDQR